CPRFAKKSLPNPINAKVAMPPRSKVPLPSQSLSHNIGAITASTMTASTAPIAPTAPTNFHIGARSQKFAPRPSPLASTLRFLSLFCRSLGVVLGTATPGSRPGTQNQSPASRQPSIIVHEPTPHGLKLGRQLLRFRDQFPPPAYGAELRPQDLM